MATKRPKPEEIVETLRQVEVLMGQGMRRKDAIRQIGVTEQTYCRRKKKCGGKGEGRACTVNAAKVALSRICVQIGRVRRGPEKKYLRRTLVERANGMLSTKVVLRLPCADEPLDGELVAQG